MMDASASRPLRGARILELTQRFPPALGGVERYVERIVVGLRAAGATVEVVTSDLLRERPFTRSTILRSDGAIPVRRHRAYLGAPAPHGVGIVVPGMLRDALRSDVDVIHAHAFGHFPVWSGRLAGALRGIPLVVTPHSDSGSGRPLSRLWSRVVSQATVRGAERTQALSELEAAWLMQNGVRPDRIRVIPPGIDVREFDSRTGTPRAPGGPVVLFVGRLDPVQKGLEPLVRAMALLPFGLGATLHLVGDDWGGLAPAIGLARDLGITDRVVARGALSRPELLREYAAADVFVLPSLFDSFPVVLLEAMAAGLPIVASRVGGVPELVDPGRTGLLVPPGNATALAEALRTVLVDPSLRARWGGEATRRVAAFDWELVMPATVAMFAELIAGPNRSQGGSVDMLPRD